MLLDLGADFLKRLVVQKAVKGGGFTTPWEGPPPSSHWMRKEPENERQLYSIRTPLTEVSLLGGAGKTACNTVIHLGDCSRAE